MKEGLRRIAIVFKGLGLLCVAMTVVYAFGDGGRNLGANLGAGALMAGGFWCVGWIIEGFTEKA